MTALRGSMKHAGGEGPGAPPETSPCSGGRRPNEISPHMPIRRLRSDSALVVAWRRLAVRVQDELYSLSATVRLLLQVRPLRGGGGSAGGLRGRGA